MNGFLRKRDKEGTPAPKEGVSEPQISEGNIHRKTGVPSYEKRTSGAIDDCKTNVQVSLFRANFEKLLCIRARLQSCRKGQVGRGL
jgi:hypothetical protein